jgi:hypothetical protein
MLAFRRSTPAIVGSEPAWAKPSSVAQKGGALRSRISAFARPARSGGRTGALGRLPGVAYEATRRTPIPLRLWLVSGDALGERDETDDKRSKRRVKRRERHVGNAGDRFALTGQTWPFVNSAISTFTTNTTPSKAQTAFHSRDSATSGFGDTSTSIIPLVPPAAASRTQASQPRPRASARRSAPATSECRSGCRPFPRKRRRMRACHGRTC